MKYFGAVLLLLCLLSRTNAQTLNVFVTGNDLYEKCNSKLSSMEGYCLGFVAGVIDGVEGTRIICKPRGVNLGQMRDIVVKYLITHPENRHLAASSIVRTHLHQLYPCQ